MAGWFGRVYSENTDNSGYSTTDGAESKFQAGLKVRDRRVSLSMKQVYGHVVSNKGGVLTVEWVMPDGKKSVEEFDLNYQMPLIERRIAIVGE